MAAFDHIPKHQILTAVTGSGKNSRQDKLASCQSSLEVTASFLLWASGTVGLVARPTCPAPHLPLAVSSNDTGLLPGGIPRGPGLCGDSVLQ